MGKNTRAKMSPSLRSALHAMRMSASESCMSPVSPLNQTSARFPAAGALPFSPKSLDIDLSNLFLDELDNVLKHTPRSGSPRTKNSFRQVSTEKGTRRMIQFESHSSPITVSLGDSLLRHPGLPLQGSNRKGASSTRPRRGPARVAMRSGFAIHEDAAVPLRAVNGLGIKALRERTNIVSAA